jgi:hypothetical protein
MGMGIVKGDTETTINPQGDLTREQAAKLVTYAALGADVADKLATTSDPFDDVAATRWSAGYISYCVSAGIINGDGNGKFRPTDNVTGYEFAKMMLCVLGYGKSDEYTGKTWAVNVARDALSASINLFDGVLVAASNEPINREEAFQVVYNTITGPQTQSWSKLTETYTSTGRTIAQSVFGLTSTPTTDSFGRPTTTYTQAGNAIATVVTDANLVYTAPVTEAKVFADLGLTAAVASATIRVDGAAAQNQTLTYNGGAIAASGNGVELSVYYTASTNSVAMFAVNTRYTTVSAVTPATAVSKETVTLTAGGGTFAISGLSVGDTVIYTQVSGGAVQSVSKVEATTVTPTSYTANSFVAGGQTYQYSANNAGGTIAGFTPVQIYLDSYGYVINTAAVNPVPNYAVVLNTNSTTPDWTTGVAVLSAQLLKADGTVEVVEVTSLSGITNGDIVTYADGTGANAGKVVLTWAASTANYPTRVTTGTVGFTVAAANHKANANTIFLVKTVANGVASYKAYTGISNVPSITASTATTYVAGTGTNAGYDAIVYVDTATLASTPNVTNTIVYVASASAVQNNDAEKGAYTTYNAVVDGKITTINTTANRFAADALLGDVTTNAAGFISASTALSGTGIVVTSSATGTTAAANGVVAFNSVELTYTDSTAVYYIDAAGVITSSTVSAIKTDADDTVTYYTTNGVLTAAFITVVG